MARNWLSRLSSRHDMYDNVVFGGTTQPGLFAWHVSGVDTADWCNRPVCHQCSCAIIREGGNKDAGV